MRFINTTTLQFEEVPDSQLGSKENKYAILSHRWGSPEDEISFPDIRASRDLSHKKGFAKLKGFCDIAAQHGCRYGWDDTCCINKGDSSELSEAINSMYRWYRGSHLCIVYLEDVPERDMMSSAWFDRGWTLQELIGPETAYFFDGNWNLIGQKSQLLAELSRKTGIPHDVLSHDASPSTCSVAQRMSWAAKRQTTRVEDRAYSLLGIFGVSMPMIYGEREMAFLRLQRAIIGQSKDESIFAWEMGIGDHEGSYSGLLAPSPSSFLNCSEIVSIAGSTGFSETNGEIAVSLKTVPYSIEVYGAILNCSQYALPDARVMILVTRLPTLNEYVRTKRSIIGGRTFTAPPKPGRFKTRLIRVSVEPVEPPPAPVYGFWLRTLEPPGHSDAQLRMLSRSVWPMTDEICCLDEGEWGTASIISFEPKTPTHGKLYGDVRKGFSKIRWIKLGFDADFNPMLMLSNARLRLISRVQQPGIDQEWFEEATTSEKDSQVRQEIFNNRWITSEAGVPSRSYGWPDGHVIMKVDKDEGIHGILNALNLQISIKLEPIHHRALSSNVNTDTSPKRIWTLDITDTGGPDPEIEVARAEKTRENDRDWEEFYACCCSNSYDSAAVNEADTRAAQARSIKRVMDSSDLDKPKQEPGAGRTTEVNNQE